MVKAQNKLQSSSFQTPRILDRPGLADFGVWNLAVIWSFELGHFVPLQPAQNIEEP
jgi:hypothetical protein